MNNNQVEIIAVDAGKVAPGGQVVTKNFWRYPTYYFYIALDSNFNEIARNDSLEVLKSYILRNGYAIKEAPLRTAGVAGRFLIRLDRKLYQRIDGRWCESLN